MDLRFQFPAKLTTDRDEFGAAEQAAEEFAKAHVRGYIGGSVSSISEGKKDGWVVLLWIGAPGVFIPSKDLGEIIEAAESLGGKFVGVFG